MGVGVVWEELRELATSSSEGTGSEVVLVFGGSAGELDKPTKGALSVVGCEW